MTNEQWETLLAVIRGEKVEPLPVGLIIDCPWLPNWAGMSLLDYFSSESMWFDANMKAINEFPEIMFLPGFWSEYGMCTEPSAFGAQCTFWENEFPHAAKVITDFAQVANLEKPDPRIHGLLPMMLHRLKNMQPKIEEAGHAIRFAVARGPMNIASFLTGQTELLMAFYTNPDEAEKLMELVTDFLIDWLTVQVEAFPTIDGIFLLDDIIGFIGEDDFRRWALPYFRRIYDTFDVNVKFLHNDAKGLITAKFLPEMGVNFFNFSFEHTMSEIRELSQNKVTMLGNVPPRDVLAQATPDEVRQCTKTMLDEVGDTSRIILSCGGGTPPAVPSENIRAMMDAR